ncbi:MAG TPA: hypothetical protein VN151_06160 [Terracidiphilus sp.]|nr:hypothetical protein [Terracidiphilus sp.]
MRRFLAVLFVVFFGFGPLAATLEASDDACLPACCRTHGVHHCAMSSALRGWMLRTESRAPSFTAPATCPLYPGFLSQATAPVHALPALKTRLAATVVLTHASVRRCSAPSTASRISLDMRGPPAPFLT